MAYNNNAVISGGLNGEGTRAGGSVNSKINAEVELLGFV